MRLVRLVLSLAAVCAAIYFGLRKPPEWRGEVYTAGTLPVADATVIILKGTQFRSMARTGIDGKFRILLQGTIDDDHRAIVCRAGLEPAVIESPPRRGRPRSTTSESVQGSVVQLLASNPGFEHPLVTSVKDGLPQECK